MLVSEVPALREYWYPVAYSAEVGTTPRRFRIFGEDHVAWRPAEGAPVRAALDECPHRAARLSQGWVDDGCLVCPYHGWRFDQSGRCVEIPSAEPGLPIPARAHVNGVLADERYGLVWVCVGTPRAGIPDLAEADDPSFTLIHELMEEWNCSAPRIIDNALDVSHVAFVHRTSVGSAANPRLSDFKVTRDGLRLAFSVSYVVRVNEQQKINLGIDSELTGRSTHAELIQPLIFRGSAGVPRERAAARPVQDGDAGRRLDDAVLPVHRPQRHAGRGGDPGDRGRRPDRAVRGQGAARRGQPELPDRGDDRAAHQGRPDDAGVPPGARRAGRRDVERDARPGVGHHVLIRPPSTSPNHSRRPTS
ncbi:MAG: aromatic ring-hydroxylating dioxygenase subunit alpha [Ilumatobacteraceae bacterium]